MKKSLNLLISILLAFTLLIGFSACTAKDGNTTNTFLSEAQIEGLWATALYTDDTELGEGKKVFTLEIKAEEKTICFKIHTDKKTVGEALLDTGLIEGDDGPYGLYIKKVNGIRADYELDSAYWAFLIDGEMANTGVDGEAINEEAMYTLEYT